MNIRNVVNRFQGSIENIWTADRWDASVDFAFIRPTINRVVQWMHIGTDIGQFHIIDEWLSVLGAVVSYTINPIHYYFKSGREITMIPSKNISHSQSGKEIREWLSSSLYILKHFEEGIPCHVV